MDNGVEKVVSAPGTANDVIIVNVSDKRCGRSRCPRLIRTVCRKTSKLGMSQLPSPQTVGSSPGVLQTMRASSHHSSLVDKSRVARHFFKSSKPMSPSEPRLLQVRQLQSGRLIATRTTVAVSHMDR